MPKTVYEVFGEPEVKYPPKTTLPRTIPLPLVLNHNGTNIVVPEVKTEEVEIPNLNIDGEGHLLPTIPSPFEEIPSKSSRGKKIEIINPKLVESEGSIEVVPEVLPASPPGAFLRNINTSLPPSPILHKSPPPYPERASAIPGFSNPILPYTTKFNLSSPTRIPIIPSII